MNVRYVIVLCCLFFGVENLKAADTINSESVRALFPFKTLTEQQKQLVFVPCEPGMHVGACRRYWDTPMMSYFSKNVQNADRVLEIGCAMGALSFQLCAEKSDSTIVAIDFNELALNSAAEEQRRLIISGEQQFRRIQFVHTDFGKQFFFERAYNFDRISFFNVAHFMTPSELNAAFCNIRNCLTENGVLYFSMVSMIASVKADLQFMECYKNALIQRDVNYPGYVYGTSNDPLDDRLTFTYEFAEMLTDIPFAYQDIDDKKVLFLGDKETIKRMMLSNGLKPMHMFYSSAKKEKHFESISDALEEASDFTLNIVAKLR
ncbi:MAG: class I SAM-dependent methyltransferase [Pseudomonadota bacterium]